MCCASLCAGLVVCGVWETLLGVTLTSMLARLRTHSTAPSNPPTESPSRALTPCHYARACRRQSLCVMGFRVKSTSGLPMEAVERQQHERSRACHTGWHWCTRNQRSHRMRVCLFQVSTICGRMATSRRRGESGVAPDIERCKQHNDLSKRPKVGVAVKTALHQR